jgi:hypothetical protein
MHLRTFSVGFAAVLVATVAACGATNDDAGTTHATGSGGASGAGVTSGASGGAGAGPTSATSGPASSTASGSGGDGAGGSSGSGAGGAAGAAGATDDAGSADAASDAGGEGGGAIDATTPPIDGGSHRAVFIWGSGEHLPTPTPTDTPMALDVTMKARLQAKGFTVDMIVDQLSKVDDVTGKALLVISSSINRDNLLDNKVARFKNVAVPTIVMKDGTIEVMGLGMGSAGGFSTDVGMTELTIVAPGDPLAAGLTGNVNVYTKGDRLIWSVPGASAKKIATIVGHADEVGIFAYAAGATMVSGVAPAKRMAFFIHRNTDYSPDGLKLFDAAIDYLIAP